MHKKQGDHAKAILLLQQALSLARPLGDPTAAATALDGLGGIYLLLAEESYARALAIYACIGNGHGLANTPRDIGDLRRNQARKVEAATPYEEALDLYARLGLAGDFEDVSRRQAGV
ncbi:hypothetical protein FRC00_014278 [Tulasnella sp. 408]|nr:hypothetical protein FRC00_014278 [Tulasnella sp. 408]